MDASRPSPSFGPRTLEHTKLTAMHVEVTLPSSDLPSRKRQPKRLKDETLRSEPVDFATLSSSAAGCSSPTMQPNYPNAALERDGTVLNRTALVPLLTLLASKEMLKPPITILLI